MRSVVVGLFSRDENQRDEEVFLLVMLLMVLPFSAYTAELNINTVRMEELAGAMRLIRPKVEDKWLLWP